MKKKQLLALALVGAMSAGAAAQMAPAITFAAEEHQEQAMKERKARKNFAEDNDKLAKSPLLSSYTALKTYLEKMDIFEETHNNNMAFSEITGIQKEFADLYALLGNKFSGFTSPNGSVLEFAAAQPDKFDYKDVEYTNEKQTKVKIDEAAGKLQDIKAAAKEIDAGLDREIAKQERIIKEAQARIDAKKDVTTATADKKAAEAKLENAKTAKVDLSNAVISAVYAKEYNRVREMVKAVIAEANAKVELMNVKDVQDVEINKYNNMKYIFDRYADSAQVATRYDELEKEISTKKQQIERLFEDNSKHHGIKYEDIKKVLDVDYVIDKLTFDDKVNTDKYLLSDEVRDIMAKGTPKTMGELIKEYKDLNAEFAKFGGSKVRPTQDKLEAQLDKSEEAEKIIKAAEKKLTDATKDKEMAMQLGMVGEYAKKSAEAFKTYKANLTLIANEKTRYEEAEGNLKYAENLLKNDPTNEVASKSVESSKTQMTTSAKIMKDLKDANDELMKSILALNAGIIKGVSNYELEKLAEDLKTKQMNLINLAKEYGFKDLEIKIVETPVEGAGTWVKDANGTWFFRNHQGRDLYKDSWNKIDNVWYRFDKNGAMLANKWFKDTNNRWYWLNASGRMAEKEWVNVDGSWFFAYGNGVIAENEWVLVNGTWYYAQNGGYIAIDKTLNINGVDYSFDATGALK